MRVVFMGTSEFGVPALNSINAHYQVCCVYSRPPKPTGRGQKEQRSPIHRHAICHDLLVRTPKSFNNPTDQVALETLNPDIVIVVSYGLILPKLILSVPAYGCINIHASLLPRWRGAAPIQRAIMAGDTETGVTIMRMNEGIDTGEMLLKESLTIDPDTTAGHLSNQLSTLGARLIVEAIDGLVGGTIKGISQANGPTTYAAKIGKHETKIDWTRSAKDIDRHVRAFSPAPGAWTMLEGKRVRIFSGQVVDRSGVPGTVLDDMLMVACGRQAYRATFVQLEGRTPMNAQDYLRGKRIPVGTTLG